MYAFIYLTDLIYLNHRYFGYRFVFQSHFSHVFKYVVEACLYNRSFFCNTLSLILPAKGHQAWLRGLCIPEYLFTWHSIKLQSCIVGCN